MNSEELKKLLASALATFIGVYFALCLFSATHKTSTRGHHPVRRPAVQHRADRANFDKKLPDRNSRKDINRTPVRVNIETEKK